MSAEFTLAERPELDLSPYIEPAIYVGAVRELVSSGSVGRISAVAPSVREQMDLEEASSRALVEQEQTGLVDTVDEPEAVDWISDGFSSLMSRMVKLSARAAAIGHDISPFSAINDDNKADIRRYALKEYLRLCKVLSATDKPAKNHYYTAPFWHHTPESAARLIEANKDLGKSTVTRVLMRSYLNSEATIEEVRQNIDKASQEFPAITPKIIRSVVSNSPHGYQKALRQYAERNGLIVNSGEQPLPDTESFLLNLRHLIRSRRYNLDRPRSSVDLTEKVSQIGEEALALIDEVSGAESLDGIDPAYHILRQAFKRKVELLTIGANRAWRKGDLPLSTEQAPPEFRREFYLRVLGDFLIINAEFGSNISLTSMREQQSVYYSAEQIRKIVADNSDISPDLLRELVLQDTEHPERAIGQFRDKVRDLMAADPRLTRYSAMRLARRRPNGEIRPAPEQPSDMLSPSALLESTRRMDRKMRVGVPPREIKFEIDRYDPEVRGHYQVLEWTFSGIRIPENSKAALIKIVEDFMVVNDRAYRRREVSTRFRDLELADRLSIYDLLAEDFAKTGEILNVRSPADWGKLPVLYITPDEIIKLRSQYDCLSNKAFRRILLGNNGDIRGALERAKRLKSDLQTWYPGISDELASYAVVRSPLNASSYIMMHLREVNPRPSKRFDSRTKGSDLSQPEAIYKHLRMKFKYGLSPQVIDFNETASRQIADLRRRATDLVDRRREATNIDASNLEKFLDHLEDYAKGSEVLAASGSFPHILRLPVATQNRFIKSAYANQASLNRLVANGSANGETKFRIYEFGFFHDAQYLKTLWKQYRAYFPENLITYTALTSPHRPTDKLDDLVEYRARLVMDNPDLSPADINRALTAKARSN